MSSRIIGDTPGESRFMKVTCVEVVPLVREAFQQGRRVHLTAMGVSMRPFIRSGDVVELAAMGARTLTPGTVVLTETTEGKYLLHRLTRRTADGVFTRGDANFHEEGPFSPACVVARATGVVRGERVAPLDTGMRRIMAYAWHATRAGVCVIEVYDRARRAAGCVLRRFGLRPPLAPTP